MEALSRLAKVKSSTTSASRRATLPPSESKISSSKKRDQQHSRDFRIPLRPLPLRSRE